MSVTVVSGTVEVAACYERFVAAEADWERLRDVSLAGGPVTAGQLEAALAEVDEAVAAWTGACRSAT